MGIPAPAEAPWLEYVRREPFLSDWPTSSLVVWSRH